jgi:HPt (histidine-containing phosphotransfer) domain-containing protein
LQALLQQLRQIDGVDVEQGLASVRGNLASYIRLLRQYVSTHSDNLATLSQLIEHADFDQAYQWVHGLKGVSGTLGLTQIQQSASQLTMALRQQAPRVQLLQAACQLETELKRLLNSLEHWLRKHAEEPALASDWPRAYEVLRQLQSLLSNDDVRANNTFAASSALLHQVLGVHAKEIENRIHSFDYPHALKKVNQILNAPADLNPPLQGVAFDSV